MGASSSGLLDDSKITHIKGLVNSSFQSFSGFYRQQYSVAFLGHLHQEVEPNKEGRSLLLKHRPSYKPEDVLYQGNVKFSGWDEAAKKFKERYVVLRRDYCVEIHDSKESLSRGCAAKLVLQPAGSMVFITDGESRAHLEKTCAGILNGVKDDYSPGVQSPEVFAVYLHLPYTGHTCFLFQQVKERDQFLSDLKTCIRHHNIGHWRVLSHESKAFALALHRYLQDKGCYQSWGKLLGSEEQVLATQVMEEVLPWLQSQLQTKLKGKKTDRMRLWMATVQATYTQVLEQLTTGLKTLREDCRKTASASQALIRSDLDQIMTSQHFLEQKVRACIHDEAERVCSESAVPYMSSILEMLSENIGAAILGMQHTLRTQMDSAFSLTNGRTEETKMALASLHSLCLDESYKKVEDLMEKLNDLKQRFGFSSAERLIHSAHLEMEQLLDSAVYTLEQFLQTSQVPVKMDRTTARVFKQLEYDSRVVQKKLYQEALLEITLPSLTKTMDRKWKTELQQFEQYIFSDYSNFILVHNVYHDVLRNILSKEIETVVKDAAGKKNNNLLLDTSDLAISQYSLLGLTPPHSTPDSPTTQTRSFSGRNDEQEALPLIEDQDQAASVSFPIDVGVSVDAEPESSVSQTSDNSATPQFPLIIVTQQCDEDSEDDENSEHDAKLTEVKEEDLDRRTTLPSIDPIKAESSNTEDEVNQPDQQFVPSNTIPDQPVLQYDQISTILDPHSDQEQAILDPHSNQRCTIPHQTDPQSDPECTIPHQTDPQSDPGCTISHQTDPQSDPGCTIPHQPDPKSDPGCTIPHQTDPQSVPGRTIPHQTDPQSDPGFATRDQPDPQPDQSSNIPSSSIQSCSSNSSEINDALKLGLGSLMEGIGPGSMEPVMGNQIQQHTDRAVYLTGQIKDSWENERIKVKQEEEATEKEGSETVRNEEEKDKKQINDFPQKGKPYCSSVREGDIIPTLKQTQSEEGLEEKKGHIESQVDIPKKEENSEKGDDVKKERHETVLQNCDPVESESAEPPPDSVDIIRQLVTEIIEVETEISPCSIPSTP